MHTRRYSLLYSLALLCVSNLTLALTPWESIHQTIHTYPLAIDSKDFALLSKVFTSGASANYTGDLSNLNGLPAIQTALAASVANVYSQHLLGTTVIDIHSNGINANSTTYFQASLFGKPYSIGSVVSLYGYYADTIERATEGWRISKRLLVFQGPGFVGNLSLVGM
ncbi:hypothetical protein HO173_000593 [Letharia columbiana]|uniref:SnoaL-like domain-containing protein n=1 Tax=Letharia columbiana TaxID=112416 RepID=A0A8H6G7J2_9LECA|nr:uncharacterized protein HO173_000593 [Letharia columbiana]KAF6241881.1 hypothetical protein HO173_000593 [Letharia columbiana]